MTHANRPPLLDREGRTDSSSTGLHWACIDPSENFNPPTLDALVGTVETPTLAIGFDPLTNDEFALLWVKPGTPGSVPFRFNKSRTTGKCSFGPVLALRPLLRCPRGKIHRIPFRVADGQFIINVGAAKPVTPENRGPRARS